MPDLQQQITELRRKIESLELLRSTLGEDAYQKVKTDLESQLRPLIATGGGTVILGNATADHGGKIVARDDYSQTIIVASQQMLRELLRAKPPVDLKPATEAYVRFLIDRHRYLNLKGMGVFDKVPIRLPLLDLYVPLKARLDLPEGETWKRGALQLAGRDPNADLTTEEGQAFASRLSEPQPVLELLQKNAGLIILGDPGAGKTTFLKFLALQLALGQGEAIGLGNRLPILAPLSGYANALIEQDVRLDDFIADYLHDGGVDLPLAEMLQSALKTGTALILLDGLDEVKDLALRHTVVERVTDFCTFHGAAGNKFVITSRIVGYRAVRPSTDGLMECTLIDFDDDEIEAFITHWTQALEQQAQGQTATALIEAARERQELLDAIRRNDSVRKLAVNPLMLTILALMKRQGVTLPERRVELYNRYVETLLSSWNRVRGLGRPPAHDLDVVQTMRVLAPLALWMHEVNPGVGLVKREDLRRKLEAIYTERGEPQPAVATTQFIEDVHEHAGLLLERGPGEYGFIHLTFEEYLAAVAMALKGQGDVGSIVDQLCSHIGDAAWREVALLSIGYLGIIQQLDGKAGEVVEQLINAPAGEAGEAIVLAGESVLDTQPGGVPLTSKRKVIEALITTMQNASVKPLLRHRAGLLLGRLGWTPDDLDQFVEVPAGKFLYGDEKETREISQRYWIAKYSVTNLQFKRFIDAGGYDQQQWWSTAGWSWRNGSQVGPNAYRWLSDKKLRQQLIDWANGRSVEERRQPYWWNDLERNNPIFPVVGITWYEAVAYTKWLNQQLTMMVVGPQQTVPPPDGFEVRLATEEEWECAARGTDGREYPWQGEFDFGKANVAEETGKGFGTTAVCTYPLGNSPVGAADMSGNVWEWTHSWYDQDKDTRVVRGGSWSFNDGFARCAFRDWVVPIDFNDRFGFRVVVSLAFFEF
jgi:formylglycine-generating enzyme required for sulfatase activity